MAISPFYFHFFFFPPRGLRHGDPISSLLFVISEKPLNRGLSHGFGITLFKLSRYCPSVTHMLFADDCLIFTIGAKKNLSKLMDSLFEYASSSGQQINPYRSSYIVHHSLSNSKKGIIASSTGFQEGSCPFAYLGAPISYKKSSSSCYDFLIEKVCKEVAGWRRRFLSSGGKITLLTAILSSIPVHIIVGLKPAQVVIDRIELVFSHFFWGDSNGKHKKS